MKYWIVGFFPGTFGIAKDKKIIGVRPSAWRQIGGKRLAEELCEIRSRAGFYSKGSYEHSVRYQPQQ